MSRRKFLMQTGLALAALATTLPARRARANPLGKPIGIQLWTVKDAMETDAPGTLKKLREIGYGAVESAGFGKRSAKEFRALLDDAGLACPSAHLSFDPANLGPAFDDAHAVGAKYATSGSLDSLLNKPGMSMKAGMTLDDAKRAAELTTRIGEAAKRAGLQYVYHNHFGEFADQGGGKTAYDFLLHETDAELVKFEIDCGWMKFAGHDPVDYFNKHPNRFPLIHVKDYLAESKKSGEMLGAELGHGVVDYKPIFAAAAKGGLQHYFVEQEGPFARMTPLEAARIGYGYLHSLG